MGIKQCIRHVVGAQRRGGSSRNQAGQMTIELAVAFPVLIIVAVIATNAVSFFGACGMFDRVAHQAVRIHATAPAYQQQSDECCALVQETIKQQMNANNVQVEVQHGVTGADLDEYRATLTFYPTLFGLGLRSQVFGVALPGLSHTTRYVVDQYKPGVIV